MNLRRGFRRITLILAIVTAVICAGWSVSTIYWEHYWAQGRLQNEQGRLQREQKRYKEHLEAKQRPQEEKQRPQEEKKYTLDELEKMLRTCRYQDFWPRGPKVKTEAELKQLEAKVKELEKGFWATLSSRALVGLFVLAGSGGAVAGFAGFWLFYLLIKWVVRGFYG